MALTLKIGLNDLFGLSKSIIKFVVIDYIRDRKINDNINNKIVDNVVAFAQCTQTHKYTHTNSTIQLNCIKFIDLTHDIVYCWLSKEQFSHTFFCGQ